MRNIQKILQVLKKIWVGKVFIFIFISSLIVFVISFLHLKLLNVESHASSSIHSISNSRYSLPLSLFFAMASIPIFYISTLLRGSLRDSIGGMAGILNLIGLFFIVFIAIINPYPKTLETTKDFPILISILNALEFAYFSAIYLFSSVGCYLFLYNQNNKN